jgi:hypothetical protein
LAGCRWSDLQAPVSVVSWRGGRRGWSRRPAPRLGRRGGSGRAPDPAEDPLDIPAGIGSQLGAALACRGVTRVSLAGEAWSSVWLPFEPKGGWLLDFRRELAQACGLHTATSRHVLHVIYTSPTAAWLTLRTCSPTNVGTGAIRGGVSGRNERPQRQFGPTLHRHDLRVGLCGRRARRDQPGGGANPGPGGARRLVLLAGAAGRRGPLVGEVLTGWDGCSTTRRE